MNNGQNVTQGTNDNNQFARVCTRCNGTNFAYQTVTDGFDKKGFFSEAVQYLLFFWIKLFSSAAQKKDNAQFSTIAICQSCGLIINLTAVAQQEIDAVKSKKTKKGLLIFLGFIIVINTIGMLSAEGQQIGMSLLSIVFTIMILYFIFKVISKIIKAIIKLFKK